MRSGSFILLSLLLLEGFFSFSQTGITFTDSMISNGLKRKFRVYVPASYNGSKPFPLVINLHGLASNAFQQQFYGNFMLVADTADFLVVHPEGTSSGGTQYWNAGLFAVPDDVKFINDLVDSLGLDYNVEKDAVYSCGLSNGAILSYYLACSVPRKIAAIASVAGTMFRTWFDACIPAFAVPVMEIHGTDDGTIPYNGNSTSSANGIYMPADTIIQKWMKHNRCNPVPMVTALPDIAPNDFSTVVNYRYSGGVNNSSVELYKVSGGGHTWPGAPAVIFRTNQDFNASAEIWRFFRPCRLSQFTIDVGLRERDALHERIKVFPNPAAELLSIDAPEGAVISVSDLLGNIIFPEIKAGQLDVSSLSAGLYMLNVKEGNVRAAIKITIIR